MLGKGIQKILFNGKVLHNLRRQFHEIPVHIGTAQALVSGIGKHAVQGVSELVQEGVHFREGEEGRLVCRRLGEVHGYRYMRTAVAVFILPLFLVAGHPGTGAFAGSRVEIGIEYCQETTVAVEHVVGFHIGMVNWNLLVFLEGDAIQAGCQSEDPVNHAVQFKVGAEGFLVPVEFLFFQLF